MMSQHIFLFFGIFIGFLFVQQLINVRFDLLARARATAHTLSSQAKSHAWKKNDEVSQSLYPRVRVLCWIMTRPENLLKKLQHVRATWTKHCNLVLYMSSQSSDFPTVGLNVSEGRSQLYWKTIRAFQYLHAHHLQDADWFLKADDDTFVVVENLRYLLSQHDTEEPVYFGHRFRPLVRQGYMSGGAGYVLSREALRRFVQGFSTGRCKNFSSVEDMALGRCMETMGVKPGDSRDPNKRETFNPFTPETLLISPKSGKQAWSYSYYKTKRKPDCCSLYNPLHDNVCVLCKTFSRNELEMYVNRIVFFSVKLADNVLSYSDILQGPGCCADFAISFHYVKPADMYTLEYFAHHLRPFGYKYRFNTNPETKQHQSAHTTT